MKKYLILTFLILSLYLTACNRKTEDKTVNIDSVKESENIVSKNGETEIEETKKETILETTRKSDAKKNQLTDDKNPKTKSNKSTKKKNKNTSDKIAQSDNTKDSKDTNKNDSKIKQKSQSASKSLKNSDNSDSTKKDLSPSKNIETKEEDTKSNNNANSSNTDNSINDKVETKIVVEDEVTSKYNVIDNFEGEKKRIVQEGQDEITRYTYEVTYIDGKEKKRKKESEEIIQHRKDKIVETYVKIQDKEIEIREIEDKSKPIYEGSTRDRWFVKNIETGEIKYFYNEEKMLDEVDSGNYVKHWGTAEPEFDPDGGKIIGYETKKEKVVVKEEKWAWKR